MDILKKLQDEFNITKTQAENIVKLIDEENTIPFIARYRKELTGSLDDQILRQIYDRLVYLRSLKERREQIKHIIIGQDNMTEEIDTALNNANTLTELEDIYRPFKPKRRTRATAAKEKGLEPLALLILQQEVQVSLEERAKEYLNEAKEVFTVEEAINGAKDIISEIIADDPNYRSFIRKITMDKGYVVSKAVDEKSESVYEMYYAFTEPVKKIVGHRVLALNRGEKENYLKVKIEPPVDEIINILNRYIIKDNIYTNHVLKLTIEDSYKRLIEASVEREIRNLITEKAQEGAIKVFSKNLKQLLLQPPIKDKIVLALDPGFRTGCKVAVINGLGKVLQVGVIYPTPPQNKIQESRDILISWIQKYDVDIVAIGNGTASRETESFVVNMLKELDKKVFYIIVNEAGASVYSASKLASLEFPDYDVALRSAVSIGRRIQDPLAELVKIQPASIGVGQYQHDMNQKRLSETLGGVVEDCVNSVGVDLNTASVSLLSYVSGVTNTIAENILNYRDENGKFQNRKELLKVKKLGPKAYQQCAGFLRILHSTNPLDNTGVHPESYKNAEKLLQHLNYSKEDVRNKSISEIKGKISDLHELAQKLEIGVPTLLDIINELEKPGRDPREDMPEQILRSDVLSIDDLEVGMMMQGTVRNVIDFGVFVDIGVHQDGLVHISEISDKFIKHPLEVLSLGDVVKVKVLSVHKNKNRISLTMKGI